MTKLRCAKCGAFVSSVKQRLFEGASSGIYIRCRKCKAILDATQYSLLRYWNYTKSLGAYWCKTLGVSEKGDVGHLFWGHAVA